MAPAGTVSMAVPTACAWGGGNKRSPSHLTSQLQKAHLGMAESSLTFWGRRSWVGGESWQSCLVRGKKRRELKYRKKLLLQESRPTPSPD